MKHLMPILAILTAIFAYNIGIALHNVVNLRAAMALHQLFDHAWPFSSGPKIVPFGNNPGDIIIFGSKHDLENKVSSLVVDTEVTEDWDAIMASCKPDPVRPCWQTCGDHIMIDACTGGCRGINCSAPQQKLDVTRSCAAECPWL